MAIKQAQYKMTLASGENIYHFETDDNMVKIVDENKNVLGTFKEFGMEGKTVTSGAFTDLKITGIYKVTNLTGLPTGYAIGKMSILSVKAVGKVGNPDLISYDLFSQTGDIYHNVVLGSTPTGWTSGGTTVKNALSALTNGLGDLTKLNTTAKGSLVNAVNEVSLKLNSTASTLASLTSDFVTFKDHNHDDKYVTKSGDLMTGNLGLKNNTGLLSKMTTGIDVNLLKLDNGNNVQLGDSSRPLKINSSGNVLLNGSKVWTEGNDGSGSGLDADKLDGVDSSLYARTDKRNYLQQDINISNGKSVYIEDGSLFFGESYEKALGRILYDSSGRLSIYNNGERFHSITGVGNLESWHSHDLYATNREVDVRFRLNGKDEGMGLYRNNSSKYLGFYNWEKGERAGYVDEETSEFYFDKQISISGRKLYLQSSTPTGSRTTGDIWIA